LDEIRSWLPNNKKKKKKNTADLAPVTKPSTAATTLYPSPLSPTPKAPTHIHKTLRSVRRSEICQPVLSLIHKLPLSYVLCLCLISNP
jgi:hypothetical protein